MAVYDSLQNAANILIDSTKFGKDVTLYPYASCTKTQDSEGEYTFTALAGTTTIDAIKVSGNNFVTNKTALGWDNNEQWDYIIKGATSINEKDLIEEDSVRYEVTEIERVKPGDTTVMTNIRVRRVEKYIQDL